MFSSLRDKLHRVEGRSSLVIVVVCDIRGFSSFSERQDSAEVGLYITAVYRRLIDEYFNRFKGAFIKPTGDGLLIVVPYAPDNLEGIFRSVMTQILHAHADFPEMFANDPMINFPTPPGIGFGVTRGSASALVALGSEDDGDNLESDDVIDYSGSILNRATRLQEVARPSGIVIDGAARLDLLDPERLEEFESEDIYLRSVAESKPIQALIQKNVIQIPEINLSPMIFDWHEDKKTTNLAHLRQAARHMLWLSARAVDEESLTVSISCDILGGYKEYALKKNTEYDLSYSMGRPGVGIFGGRDVFKNRKLLINNTTGESAITLIARYRGS